MAGDKAEGNFDAVVGKSPTLFAGFLRTAFGAESGLASNAAIGEMANLAPAQGLLNGIDGVNAPVVHQA